MRAAVLTLLVAGPLAGFAQTKIEKTVPIRAGQQLEMVLEYPELVRVQTWQNDHVLVKGEVSINMGEHDSAFGLQVDQSGDKITITSSLRDEENIPKRLVIYKGDTEYMFKASDSDDPAVRKFLEEHGPEYTCKSYGIVRKIRLEIFVPEQTTTRIEAKYGMVEVTAFRGPLTVSSRFGGIDASIAAGAVGELKASTHFGEILTNLDLPLHRQVPGHDHDNKTVVTARLGAGPGYSFESKFGKVYLRKAE